MIWRRDTSTFLKRRRTMILHKTIKAIPVVGKISIFFWFILFQMKIRKAEKEDLLFPTDTRGVAIPPARFRHRVDGSLEREHFLQVGETIATDIRNLVTLTGHDWYSFSDILDFGCGCGRVIRWFLDQENNAHLYGTDIDPAMVEWCKKNIPGVDWSINHSMPPTEYADESFDLVYAISVFTHLDERYQNAWLAELQRITRPGAILILTVHGENVISKTPLLKAQRDELEKKGFLFVTGTTGTFKLDGLPDFYQSTFHTHEYIQRIWSQYFDVLQQHHEGNSQDAVILRRR
jgi:SAM-dependent methyltransferase